MLAVCAIALAAGRAPLPAQVNDSAAVVGVAEALLRGLGARDTAGLRLLLMPGAHFVSALQPAPPTARARVEKDSLFYLGLSMGKERLLERMWTPIVAVHGSVATVQTPYDFHVDGTFSHCGIDVFVLVRDRGTWRVSSVTYTVQRQGCAPSPLGPPQ